MDFNVEQKMNELISNATAYFQVLYKNLKQQEEECV